MMPSTVHAEAVGTDRIPVVDSDIPGASPTLEGSMPNVPPGATPAGSVADKLKVPLLPTTNVGTLTFHAIVVGPVGLEVATSGPGAGFRSGAGAGLVVSPADAGVPALLPPPQPVTARIVAAAPPHNTRRRPSSSSFNMRSNPTSLNNDLMGELLEAEVLSA